MGDLNYLDLTDGSRGILFATSDDGVVHCVRGDGSDCWHFEPGGQRFAGTISVGHPDPRTGRRLAFVVSRHKNVYALDPSGGLAWTAQLHADSIYGGPTVAGPHGNQMTVHGGDRGRLFALDPEGKLLWFFTAGGAIHSAPGVGDVDGDGRTEIFFGCEDSYLYSLRDDGSLRWRYKTREVGDGIASGPILADLDGDGRTEVVCGSCDHHIYCLDADDGFLRWERRLRGRIRNGLAVADLDEDGKLEVLAGDVLGLTCLSWNGEIVWEFRSEGGEMVVAVPPVVADVTGDGRPNVVFGTQTGSLYCLDAEGALVWEIPLGEEEIEASPLIADVDGDGKLELTYATSTGKVVCLETPVPAKEELPWPMGRRKPTLNPDLVARGSGATTSQLAEIGIPVEKGREFDGGVALEVDREVLVKDGPQIWWDVETENPSLQAASPVRLYVASTDPETPIDGTLDLRASSPSRESEMEYHLQPKSGSQALDVHLGELVPSGEGLRIEVTFMPRVGEAVTGPQLRLRHVGRQALLDRLRAMQRRVEELDSHPRGPPEDLTRELVLKCLGYAEEDARGQALGRAEAMLSDIEEQLGGSGYSWDLPSREPSKRVAIDGGVVRVDGKPFFPLGFYDVHTPEDVRMLASLGFNTVFNSGDDDFLDACDREGLMVIAHGPGESMQNFSALNRIRRRMEDLYWRPCLMAWYVVDEPSMRNVPPEVIRRASELVGMVDPWHLTMICDGSPYRGKPYQALADVASPAFYPIWKQMPPATVARCVDDTVSSVPDGQPVWFVLQAWTWRNIRFPTPEEERVMAYLAIIHGARGLSWYAFRYPNKDVLLSVYEDSPELWEEILRIAGEAKELERWLLLPRVPARVWCEGPSRVDWCLIEEGGEALIIACNPTKESTTPALDLGTSPSRVEVLWEGRTLDASDGKLRDRMPPMSVRFYTFPLA
jgi:outer membrane protein assembly factor BamB